MGYSNARKPIPHHQQLQSSLRTIEYTNTQNTGILSVARSEVLYGFGTRHFLRPFHLFKTGSQSRKIQA